MKQQYMKQQYMKQQTTSATAPKVHGINISILVCLVVFGAFYLAPDCAHAQLLDKCHVESEHYEHCKRRNTKRFARVAVSTGLSMGYLGLAIGLREGPYADNPQDNGFGTVNGSLGSAILGGITGGASGAFLGFLIGIAVSQDIEVALMSMVISGLICAAGGVVTGAILGYHFRREFKESRGLYYSSAAITAVIPAITVIAYSF